MTSLPSVDIIIPTRNRERLTREAIASVSAQTFPGWRLLVVDDASDDGSAEGLSRYAASDPRITVLTRREKGGAQTARQTGLESAKAPFVAILDSDDLWGPTKLERQLAHYDRYVGELEDLGAVLCGHVWVDAAGQQRGGARLPRVHGRASPLASDNMSTILVRRDFLVRAGGFLPPGQRSRAGANHVDFYLRLTRHCSFTTVPEVLVTCRAHSEPRDSDVLRSRSGADALAELLVRHGDHLENFPDDLAQLRARVGARYLAIGERRAGLSYLLGSLRGAGPRSATQIVRRYGWLTVRSLVPRRSQPSAGNTDHAEREVGEAVAGPTPKGADR